MLISQTGFCTVWREGGFKKGGQKAHQIKSQCRAERQGERKRMREKGE